jgi:hypothetical protein
MIVSTDRFPVLARMMNMMPYDENLVLTQDDSLCSYSITFSISPGARYK